MYSFSRLSLKFIICFVIFYLNFGCFGGKDTSDLMTIDQLSDNLIREMYQMYKEAVADEDNIDSLRRLYRPKKEYTVHVKKLKAVNGYKTHNLMIKEVSERNNPLIYINNPVESKIPRAFLTLEEFKRALIERGRKLKESTNDAPVDVTKVKRLKYESTTEYQKLRHMLKITTNAAVYMLKRLVRNSTTVFKLSGFVKKELAKHKPKVVKTLPAKNKTIITNTSILTVTTNPELEDKSTLLNTEYTKTAEFYGAVNFALDNFTLTVNKSEINNEKSQESHDTSAKTAIFKNSDVNDDLLLLKHGENDNKAGTTATVTDKLVVDEITTVATEETTVRTTKKVVTNPLRQLRMTYGRPRVFMPMPAEENYDPS